MTGRAPRPAAWLLAIGALALLALVFFHQLALTDRVLGRGDSLSYFTPYWQVRAEALRAGQLPLWTPDLFMGAPLLGNSQIGALYLPNWLLAPFDAAAALKISLIAHGLWAALGVYVLARRTLGVNLLPALLAAILFAFGGLTGAQTEHINQFQGLAWLPWLFWLLDESAKPGRRTRSALYALLLSAALALQFFSGHTQTIFISVCGLALYALAIPARKRALICLLAAGGAALALAAPQIIPTLELSRLSIRSGGLPPNEVLSFSLSPFAAGRGLLPGYDGLIFPEYVAYLGVIGLGLAVIGLTTRTPARWRWIMIGAVALVLAFGAYNPLNWPLATLSPFNLFRVPARWLALVVLSGAMLAALGLEHLSASRRWQMIAALAVLSVLTASTALANRAPDSGIPLPEPVTLAGWAIGAVVLTGLWLVRGRSWATSALVGAAALELLLASAALPYNQLVSPDIIADARLTARQVAVLQEGANPPGRVLGISQNLWDSYDLASIEARYAEQGFSPLSLHTALSAIKLQDVIGANLPALWGLSSVDGYDGGLLPTRWYSDFTGSFTPDGVGVQDGRLREVLAADGCESACLPALDMLNLMDVRYLILDKTHDLFVNDIAFDTGLPVAAQTEYANPQAFVSTGVQVLYRCDAVCDAPVIWADGGPLALEAPPGEQASYWLAAYSLNEADVPANITVTPDSGSTVYAVTLVDGRTGDFQQLAPMPFTRVLSSDIKLYENVDARRAFLADDSLVALNAGDVHFTAYTPTRVALQVAAPQAATLILSDAYYPGWQATVNGIAAPIERVHGMFRGVTVPEGASTVEFIYAPDWYPGIIWLGVAVWSALAIALIVLGLRLRRSRIHPNESGTAPT